MRGGQLGRAVGLFRWGFDYLSCLPAQQPTGSVTRRLRPVTPQPSLIEKDWVQCCSSFWRPSPVWNPVQLESTVCLAELSRIKHRDNTVMVPAYVNHQPIQILYNLLKVHLWEVSGCPGLNEGNKPEI